MITDGSTGIGQASTVMFSREGAKVVIAPSRTPAGMQTVEEIGEAGGVAAFVKTDVAQAAEV